MIAAAEVRGAMPIYITENSFVKKFSGMPSILMAFSMMRVMAGNIIN